MKLLLPAALLTLAAVSGPALASAAPCNPPLNRPLRLTMTQDFFLEDGKATRAVVARILRFTRNTEGPAIEAHIAAVDTDDAFPGARERLRLAYGAPGDVPIVIRLDAAWRVNRIESLDAVWQDFRRRQTRLLGAMATNGQSDARGRGIGQMLDAMSAADRTAMLSAFLQPVLHYCGTVLPPDAQILPDGQILAETLSDAADSRDVSRYRIDGRTGLMRRLDRTVSTSLAPLRPLREQWTLEPYSEQ